MNWAREVALKIIEERPNEELYTVASGVSPSGFVHIGNFREIATPYLVAKELKKLGKKVRYILSFDEYDRFRKVPGNIDSSFEKYIGMPYTEIPSPFSQNESYAEYMEKRFLDELNQMDVEVECIYQAKEYKSGRYSKYIKLAMDNKDKIFEENEYSVLTHNLKYLTNNVKQAINGNIKNLCIEVAVQISSAQSRQAMKRMKGNHRRTAYSGRNIMWGHRKYLCHSFARRGAITFDKIRM